MVDYADDGLDWYRNLVGQQGPYPSSSDPAGQAGTMPGGMDRSAASGQGPYMGYRAQQNPFPAQLQPPAQPSLMQRFLTSINPISSAEAAPAPQMAPQPTPGTTLNTNPVTAEAPLSISGEFPHLAGAPAQPPPSLSTEFPHLGNQPLRAPAPAPAPEAAPSSGVAGGGLAAVAPASLINLGTASGNQRVREILKRANPDLSDQDIKDWAAQQLRTGGAPPSSSAGPSIPTPFINAGVDPRTLTRTQDQRPPPVPPTIFGGPPGPPPPIVQAPIPVGQPRLAPHPARAGRAGQQPIGALADPSVGGAGGAAPSPGEYFATTGNARGASWTPGGFASPPAQHFQTPLTPMFGPGQWIGGGQPTAAAPQGGGNARGGGYDVGGMFANLPNDAFNGAGGGNTQGGGYDVGNLFANLPNDVFNGAGGGGGRIATAQVPRRARIAGYPAGTGYAGGL
jgi:hypothetical protein